MAKRMASYTVELVLFSLVLIALLARASKREECLKVVEHITSSSSLGAKISPNINGNWTSSRCEVRHGGKFLTRSFTFSSNHQWGGLYHHYSDWQCTKPTFTLSVSGHYYTVGESLVVSGGTRAYFNFTSIKLYSHTQAITARILKTVTKSCPNTINRLDNTLNDAFSVSGRAFAKRSCRNTFGISEYELRLLRLETYHKLGKTFDNLLFGEIPTTDKTKRKYKPDGYQMPLLRSDNFNCSICSLINRASANSPPILQKKPKPTPDQLTGQWGSTRCEVRPKGTFITRHLITNSEKGKWEGHFFFFLDSDCTQPNFILYGKGAFSGGSYSSVIPGGMKYTFMVTEARLTVFDSGTIGILKSARDKTCGVPGEWKKGVEHDITPTQGCTFLGIKLPHTEYDLLTVQVNHFGGLELYTGQRPSDGGSPDTPEKRPTSYQVPLLECSAFPFKYVPPTTLPTFVYTYPKSFTFPTIDVFPKETENENDYQNNNEETKKEEDIMAFNNRAWSAHGRSFVILITLIIVAYLH